MSKYEVGDKVVMEIAETFSDSVGIKSCMVRGFTKCGENYLKEHSEPLTAYTEPLEDKIKKLMEENIRLIAENTKLKAKDDVLKTSCDDYEEKANDMCDTARAEGQNEAWGLARKILNCDTCSGLDFEERQEIFDTISFRDILNEYTYSEATAKVEAWEKVKDEIKVGDIIKVDVNGLYAIVIHESDEFAKVVYADGNVYLGRKDGMTKTGRHIDIDSFLKQIREE